VWRVNRKLVARLFEPYGVPWQAADVLCRQQQLPTMAISVPPAGGGVQQQMQMLQQTWLRREPLSQMQKDETALAEPMLCWREVHSASQPAAVDTLQLQPHVSSGSPEAALQHGGYPPDNEGGTDSSGHTAADWLITPSQLLSVVQAAMDDSQADAAGAALAEVAALVQVGRGRQDLRPQAWQLLEGTPVPGCPGCQQ